MSTGANWLLQNIDGKVEKVSQPTRDDVAIAEKFLGDPATARKLAYGIEAVSNAMRALAESGLTEDAITLLIQEAIPKLKNGSQLSKRKR